MVLDKKFITPYMQNWNLTMEREVVRSMLVAHRLRRDQGTHLTTEYDQNAPIYNPSLSLTQNRATIDDPSPVADFQTINRWMHGLNSSYHALQLSGQTLQPRLHGQRLYTWSKNLDYVSRPASAAASVSTIPSISSSREGPRTWRADHRFVSFRGGSARCKRANHSRRDPGQLALSGIVTLQSGRPFSMGASNNPTAGAGSARADLVGAGYPVLDSGRSKDEKINAYFDKTRFANPAPNTFGTLGRNILRGPGFANVDLSLAKGWRLPFFGEAGRIEYRFEAFNAFNATHLANPVTGMTNPNFGKITSTDGDPRILQMALKVAW